MWCSFTAQQSGPMSVAGGEHVEKLYKVLVIGEIGTGKTSIIKRYVHNFFSQHYRATVRCHLRLLALDLLCPSLCIFGDLHLFLI